jgi:hypothetical protein
MLRDVWGSVTRGMYITISHTACVESAREAVREATTPGTSTASLFTDQHVQHSSSFTSGVLAIDSGVLRLQCPLGLHRQALANLLRL